jgi:type I restriction enzyme, S subunit
MSFTLSKLASPSQAFFTQLSRLEARWDPNYYRCMGDFRQRVNTCPFPIEKLKRSLELVQYGISERATEQPVGVPMLRMINLQDDTWDLSDLKYIHMTDKEKKPYLVEHGDILFNRTNSKELVGKCGVFGLTGEYVFASYLIRVRLKHGTLLPDYVTAFLSSSLGRIQIDAVSRQIAGMTNINAEEIRGLLIPALDRTAQEKVVHTWRAAIRKRDETLKKARDTLATIDDVLLEELGIPNKPEPHNTLRSRIFRRDFSSVSGKRIDPAANWKCLSLAGGNFPLRKLRDIAEINPPTRFPGLARDTLVSFVPMDAVSDIFGEIANRQTRSIAEAGSYTTFQTNDVIWAKITPCMENGKSAVADELVEGVGYGSTEFHVFRRRTPNIVPQFLHHLLRLKTVRQHARLNFTGSSGHQRVDEEFFQRMEIPFPPVKVQKRIAEKAETTKAEARKLFAEARADLEKAKRDIETLILGKEYLSLTATCPGARSWA